MPSQIATRAAERCRKRVVLGGSETFEEIIDADLAPVREALEKLNKQLRCSKPDHRKLRHPMCGDCQALGTLENALAALEVK